MKNVLSKKLVIILVVAALAIAGAAGWVISSNDNSTKEQNQTKEVEKEKEDKKLISYTAAEGKTALGQLLELNDTVVTEKSSYGTYVDSINGLKGGEDGAYWIFFIDGEMASVGADAFVTEGGELIEWKYQK